MRRSKATAALLSLAVLGGCATEPATAPDDPATMIYRECMAGSAGRWTAEDAGTAMADPGTKNTASFEAAAERKREQRQAMDCLRQAGLDSH